MTLPVANRRFWIGNDNRVYQWITGLVFLVLVFKSTIQGQESQESDSPARKVTLRWKLQPNQIYVGRLAAGIRTINDSPQTSSYSFDFRWEVQSLDNRGVATVKVIVYRERLKHRSTQVKVDYDSNSDASLIPTKAEFSQINPILSKISQYHNRDFVFRFSDRGVVEQVGNYDTIPTQVVLWPILPDQPVAVGDTWTDNTSKLKPKRFQLVKLEGFDGETIAWIEDKTSTMRYRFLVNQGRYLDYNGWDILGSPPGAKKRIVQSSSQRLRLDLEQEKGRFDRLRALQPNQPGRAIHLIAESFKQTDMIEEFLLDEKSMLRVIQERLWVEHVDNFDVPVESKNWNPVDWCLFARYYERKGDIGKYKQLLKSGAETTALNPQLDDYARNIFLLQFAYLLANIGEFEAAKKASLSISHDALSGLSITSAGTITVPKSALRSYALFVVTREQAKEGLSKEATSTAQLITTQSERAAAHWIIAMHSAEKGEMKAAIENATAAENFYSEESKVIEFGTNGPVEVPVHSYRTLSLGKLALCQAKHGDEIGMHSTLSSIKNQTEKSAVLVDLIVALDSDGRTELAERLSIESSKSTQDLAMKMRLSRRIQSNALVELEGMIDSISEPELNAAGRIEFCIAILADKNRASELQKQLDLAEATIQKISIPEQKLTMLIKHASVLIKAGRREQATKQLKKAVEMVDLAQLQQSQRMDVCLSVAELLAKIDEATEFENLIKKIERTRQSQDRFEKPRSQLLLVNAYLVKGEMEKSEMLAKKIEDASIRCQALAAVGKRYGQLLELERSREIFAEAYESAMQVVDVLGLDTVHSKGGALRYVGQEQGECDFEGMVNFLEVAPNANIRAYGLLGGVESFDPASAEAAKRIARIPDSILNDVCESSVTCQIIQGLVQPLEDSSPPDQNERP